MERRARHMLHHVGVAGCARRDALRDIANHIPAPPAPPASTWAEAMQACFYVLQNVPGVDVTRFSATQARMVLVFIHCVRCGSGRAGLLPGLCWGLALLLSCAASPPPPPPAPLL